MNGGDSFSLSDSGLSIRVATNNDLDDITRVAQAGFPDDPEWNYRFPYRDNFPEDNWKWTRSDYQMFIEDPEKYVVLVATLDVGGEMDRKVVALGVWDVAVTKEDKHKDYDSGIDERKDANRDHFKCFAESLNAAFNNYFARYHEKQYHLWLLATHPDYRRRGAGTMLTKWGIAQAEGQGWPATVLASPMGKLLYTDLGFQEVGTVTVQVAGEEDRLLISCLTRTPA